MQQHPPAKTLPSISRYLDRQPQMLEWQSGPKFDEKNDDAVKKGVGTREEGKKLRFQARCVVQNVLLSVFL